MDEHGFSYSNDYAPNQILTKNDTKIKEAEATRHLTESNYRFNQEDNLECINDFVEKNPLTKLNAKKTMAEISIPGMRAIFGHKAHVARRVTWIIILLICTAIAGVQVQDRVAYYFSTPVAVNVRVSRNDSLRFPVLTLCNKNLFNMTAMEILKREKYDKLPGNHLHNYQDTSKYWDVADLIGVRNWDAQQVWDFISHDWNQMMLECWFGRNITCNQIGEWVKVYTYMGVCYSYYLNNTYVSLTGMFNNFYLKVNDTLPILYKNDAGWKMLIHDYKDSPLIDVRTHGSTLYRGWAKDIRIYLREFRTLNIRKRPCDDSKSYSFSKCVAKCFTDAATKIMTCRLPFMEANELKYCDSPESYNQSIDAVEKLLFYGRWSSNNCTCSRQCHQDLYIPYTETTQMEKVYEKLGKLRIYYQDLTFDDIEEELGYELIPLLCDIGGSLGLLLGASVLTFFEIIEAMSAAIVAFIHKLFNCGKNPKTIRS